MGAAKKIIIAQYAWREIYPEFLLEREKNKIESNKLIISEFLLDENFLQNRLSEDNSRLKSRYAFKDIP